VNITESRRIIVLAILSIVSVSVIAALITRPSHPAADPLPQFDAVRVPIPKSATILYPAELIRVVDGDTFDCDVQVWPTVTIRARVRLADVDAPEVIGDTKVQGLEAKLWLVQALQETQGHLWLQNLGKEKWGRWMCRVWPGVEGTLGFKPYLKTSINARLVKAGHAVDLRRESR